MNVQCMRPPLVLFTRPKADTETEESDPATARDLLLIQAREIGWYEKVLLCPIRPLASVCNWSMGAEWAFQKAWRHDGAKRGT
jgi:hypothetical protein